MRVREIKAKWAELENLQVNSELTTATGTGAKSSASLTVAETIPVIHKTVLKTSGLTVTIADDAGVAQYGGVKVYDFPLGNIIVLGAIVSGTLTAGVTGTIIDAWEGDVALGTVTATTGATLTSTEADIMASTAIAAATSKVGTVSAKSVATALTESGARWLDGTSTAKDVYLNFVIDDDATHTAGTATFAGKIELIWMNAGVL